MERCAAKVSKVCAKAEYAESAIFWQTPHEECQSVPRNLHPAAHAHGTATIDKEYKVEVVAGAEFHGLRLFVLAQFEEVLRGHCVESWDEGGRASHLLLVWAHRELELWYKHVGCPVVYVDLTARLVDAHHDSLILVIFFGDFGLVRDAQVAYLRL